MAPNACATSMISGFGGPPDPRVILTPLVVSTCVAEAAGVARVWPTLAVASGASSFRGAGKTNEANRYREDRGDRRRSFHWALVSHGQRRCAARNETERLVQFVPHFSRRLSVRTPQSRESTLSEPILGRPPKIPDAGGASLPSNF